MSKQQAGPKDGEHRTTVKMPAHVWRRLRVKAAKQVKSTADLMAEILEAGVADTTDPLAELEAKKQ